MGPSPARNAGSKPVEKHRTAAQCEKRLRRGLIVVSVTWLGLLAAGLILIARSADIGRAAAWTGKAAAVLACQLLFIIRNRRRILRGPNLAHLWGTANLLTLLRGTLAAVLAGFLFGDKPSGLAGWLPALLYTLLAGLDYLDGYWARRTGTETAMGEILDQEYDALGILLAVSLAVQFGHLPAAFLSVGLARYLFAWAAAWRRRRGLPIRPLPPSNLRRRLAGFQMAVLAVVLWPVAGPPGTVLAGLIVGVPFLLGFARDWLIASAKLDPEHRSYLKARARFYRITRSWL
jgi:CDP-diacylglycerol--glycerol-3-phosphate 3-phosphatidyltransferase